MLRRALNVAVRQPKKIIGIDAVGTYVISSWPGSRGIESHPTVDVEVQELVEFLVAHIAAKLEIMISDDFAEVIAELERVADLRQLAPRVIPDGESAVQLDEGHALYLGAQPGMNAAIRRVCRSGGAGSVQGRGIAHASKTKRRGRSGPARGLNCVSPRWSVKFELSLAKKCKAELVDRRRAEGRGVAYVYLLGACGIIAGEISQRSPFRLKFREWVECVVVIKIVVHRSFLIVVKCMVDLDLKLIAPDSLIRNSDDLRGASPSSGHVLKQAKCHRIKTSRGNLIPWENTAVRSWVATPGYSGN